MLFRKKQEAQKQNDKNFELLKKERKKFLTNGERCAKINKFRTEAERSMK